MSAPPNANLPNERRTFAIISHPDAGKTTLTEKLLLFGGAIHLAGEVRARGNNRRARSDWMKIEQQRGISVTSSVMTFERGARDVQPARHAGPRGLQRGHLPHADRGRQRGHGHRRGARHRGADAQIVRGLPPARRADHHLRQQGRPRGARPVRTARRGRRPAGARRRADDVAGRHGRAVPRRVGPAPQHPDAARGRQPDVGRQGPDDRPRRSAPGRSHSRRRARPLPRRGGAGARRLCDARPRAVPQGRADAGVLRLGAEGFRRRGPDRRPRRLRPGRRASSMRRRAT